MIAAALVCTGCSDTTILVVSVDRVEVSPDQAVIEIGEGLNLEARLFDEVGNPVTGHEVRWSTDAPEVASVDDSGRVIGLSGGTVGIWASSRGKSDVATIMVQGGPAIELDPATVELVAVAGDSDPVTGVVDLRNAAGGSLRNLDTSVRYPSEEEDWLLAELGSSTAPTVLLLVADAEDLDPGEYFAVVDVTSPDAVQSPVSLEVELQVVQANPAPFLFGLAPASAPAGTTVSVTLSGSGFIDGVTEVSFGNGIVVEELLVTDETSLTATIAISAAAVPGVRDVSATNPPPGGGTSILLSSFQVLEPSDSSDGET